MPDPSTTHEAVVLYRDIMHLTPSRGRRQDIILTVKDLKCWESILKKWKANKWNPGNWSGLFDAYEQAEEQVKTFTRRW